MRLPRMLVVTAALLALAAGGSQAHPTPAAATIQAYFLQGEQLVGLQRDGSTIRAAVTALLAGPTSAELGRKVRSYVPAGTPLRSVSVANGVATVDLGERFAAGRAPRSSTHGSHSSSNRDLCTGGEVASACSSPAVCRSGSSPAMRCRSR